MAFEVWKTKIEGKEKTSEKIAIFDDVVVCVNHILGVMNTIAIEDMDGCAYCFYIVEPITWTMIRRFKIEG